MWILIVYPKISLTNLKKNAEYKQFCFRFLKPFMTGYMCITKNINYFRHELTVIKSCDPETKLFSVAFYKSRRNFL